MRRRIREGDVSNIPPRLLHYDRADWLGGPGVDCGHPECAYWAARDQWADEHPDAEWPLVAAGPDVPWGPGTGHEFDY